MIRNFYHYLHKRNPKWVSSLTRTDAQDNQAIVDLNMYGRQFLPIGEVMLNDRSASLDYLYNIYF